MGRRNTDRAFHAFAVVKGTGIPVRLRIERLWVQIPPTAPSLHEDVEFTIPLRWAQAYSYRLTRTSCSSIIDCIAGG